MWYVSFELILFPVSLLDLLLTFTAKIRLDAKSSGCKMQFIFVD